MSEKKPILIFGNGGHARWAAVVAELNGFQPVFIDQHQEKTTLKHALTGPAHIGIGDNTIRAKVAQSISACRPDFDWPALVHPCATVIGNISAGSLVLPGAVIGPNASVGQGCVLYSNSVCEHDAIMADYSSLAPGAVIGGNVQIGQHAFVGIGASVRQGAVICADAVIGAGAAVVSHIDTPGIYVGTPAQFMRMVHPGSALRPIQQLTEPPRAKPANQD